MPSFDKNTTKILLKICQLPITAITTKILNFKLIALSEFKYFELLIKFNNKIILIKWFVLNYLKQLCINSSISKVNIFFIQP